MPRRRRIEIAAIVLDGNYNEPMGLFLFLLVMLAAAWGIAFQFGDAMPPAPPPQQVVVPQSKNTAAEPPEGNPGNAGKTTSAAATSDNAGPAPAEQTASNKE